MARPEGPSTCYSTTITHKGPRVDQGELGKTGKGTTQRSDVVTTNNERAVKNCPGREGPPLEEIVKERLNA